MLQHLVGRPGAVRGIPAADRIGGTRWQCTDAVAPSSELPPLKLPISLDQARATLWPFGQLKGQAMGDLVDTNRIGLRDLAYAVENAWDRRVRDAALVLLSIRLNQVASEPEAQPGHLKVVSGWQELQREQGAELDTDSRRILRRPMLGWLQMVIGLVSARDPGSPLAAPQARTWDAA